MRLLPAAVELFLFPPYAWHVELQSPYPPADCAARLAERRAKNLFEDVTHRAGRSAFDMRWTGSVSDGGFEIVEAGLAGTVRAFGILGPAPVGSTIEMRFQLEKGQFVWDLILVALGIWSYFLFPPAYSVYIAAGVVILFVLKNLRRGTDTSLDASRLVGLVQDATKAEISKAEGGARIRPPS